MKKLVTISILLFSFQLATAQRLNVTTYVEKTNIGIKGGTAFGFENHLGFEYGGFYQELFGQERDELPRFYEKEFFGLYGAAPLMVRAKYDLKINVRMGVTNGENFLITPSLVANYQLMKIISVRGGIGARSFQPTFQAGINIKLFMLKEMKNSILSN